MFQAEKGHCQICLSHLQTVGQAFRPPWTGYGREAQALDSDWPRLGSPYSALTGSVATARHLPSLSICTMELTVPCKDANGLLVRGTPAASQTITHIILFVPHDGYLT